MSVRGPAGPGVRAVEPLLEGLILWVGAQSRPALVAERLDQIIHASRAPFEIAVASALLAPIAADGPSRRAHARALERGERVRRLLVRRVGAAPDLPSEPTDDGLAALFLDLPDLALALPAAYATHALLELLDALLVDDVGWDEALLHEARRLHALHVRGRRWSGQPLEDLLPWGEPEPQVEPLGRRHGLRAVASGKRGAHAPRIDGPPPPPRRRPAR